jgi:hypothetical protein
MHPHAPIPAAQPHLSLNAFSVPNMSCEERNCSGERPSFPGALASEVRSALGELPQPRSERVTSVQRDSSVSYPAYARSLLRGLTGALRLGALLLRLRRPSGYGFHLRWTLRKCRAWHLGAGPTSLFSDPSKIGKFKSNGDHHHVPEQSHPHRLHRQRRRSSHQ